MPQWDLPEIIVEGIFRAQQRILSGYKGHPNTDPEKFREAQNPKHVAISLTGEPTLYEHLGELINILHAKGLTTFLVSNGNLPHALSTLSREPTQLYISVCAPDKKIFKRLCRPRLGNAWELLNDTLSYVPSFRCPTVIRLTLVKNFNMKNIENYARLIEKAKPIYIEAKAYMHVGFSGLRLGFDSMPSHKEVFDFASQLSEKTGYKILDEASDSRVVLLSRMEKSIRFGSG